jgi:hypothetical protein
MDIRIAINRMLENLRVSNRFKWFRIGFNGSDTSILNTALNLYKRRRAGNFLCSCMIMNFPERTFIINYISYLKVTDF